jgi:hypothetical protein
VYNLHVEGTARYLVGACGVVVHNSPCSEAARGSTHSSKALGRALEKSGTARPSGSAAHHIVAGGAQKSAPARAVLKKFGIGVDDAENGVFLPSNVHMSVHTNSYYDTVNSALSQATTRSEAIQVLSAIRARLLGGGF